ncbi:MAG: low specificity L-threonine aldolase [Planctomycetales bacterium]|nr:low specificity L-threonine aldolase [Planctomycetales bacterium]
MIDLRSDTVTRPTPGMRQAMATAEVGDDVYGDDPTVNHLERRVADLLGMEAALYVPSGTMSNQIALRVHCQPGDEFLIEAESHVLRYEQAAYAQFFGLSAWPVTTADQVLTPELLAPHVRPQSIHAPCTRLISLEQTHNRGGGSVIPYDSIERVCQWAREQGLVRHLDGARLWNAAVATGISPADWAQHFDTVSVCFSKGLGAPVGSALCGPRTVIERARRVRKALGGGMRQAGLLAAGALYALENHVERLAEDHANAKRLAAAIAATDGLALDPPHVDTNIVIFSVDEKLGTAAEFVSRLAELGVAVNANGPQKVRAVTHLDVSTEQIDEACSIIAGVMSHESVGSR